MRTELLQWRRIWRFGVSGVVVTGVHALIAVLLIEGRLAGPAMANGVAFVCATLLSYGLNTLWSFSARLSGRTLYRFATVSVLGCGLAVVVAGALERAGMSYGWGIAGVALVVPAFTFALHSLWTYRTPS